MHARISVAKLISRLRFELGRLGGRETEAMPRQTKNSMRIYIAKLDLLVYGCGYTERSSLIVEQQHGRKFYSYHTSSKGHASS